MSNTAVFCITKSRAQGERIIDRLHRSGFACPEISALMPETCSDRDIGYIKASKAPEGIAIGAAIGGFAGGIVGVFAGLGALTFPGIGPFIAAGPLMAALSGAAIGAAIGGVVGGLIGFGIPEIEVDISGEQPNAGNYLISVHAHSSDELNRAKAIYKDQEAESISTAIEAAVPNP